MTTATQSPLSTDPTEVRAGDLMSFTYWGEVEKVERTFDGTKLQLKNVDDGTQFVVHGDTLIEASKSSEQFISTKRVSKSEAVEILASSHNKPFTVVFIKKDGSKRTLRGRLIGIDQKNLGYVDVEDLDKPVGQRFRLVDCRTIKSIIVDNVKYVV